MDNQTGLLSRFVAYTWPQRLVLLLAALFPLVSVSVASGGSTIYTLLVLPALFLAWPERRHLNRAERRWLLAYLLLFAIAALSLLNTAELELGVEKLERYLRLATLGLIYLFLRRMNVEAGRFFLLGVMAAAFSLGIQAWYQIHIEHDHFATGLYHKIVFGDMAMLGVTIMLAAVLTVASRPWHHLLLLLAIAAALYASLMSATRGSWLLLPVVLLVLGWLYRRRISRRGWALATAGLVLFAGTLALWQPATIMKPMQRGVHEIERYLENPKKAGSWGARLEMWGNSIKIWRQHTWFGTGLGDFSHDSQALVAEGLSANRWVAKKYGHAHSIYFDALAAFGAVGVLVLVLALFILPWRYFARYWHEAGHPWERFYALSGLLTVVAFAVFGLTEGWTSRNPFVNPYIIYIAVFAASLAVITRRQQERRLQS
jgi:O-antigen ligase